VPHNWIGNNLWRDPSESQAQVYGSKNKTNFKTKGILYFSLPGHPSDYRR